MGGTYYVPRNVKGESRILYIFTLKSFAVTLAFGLVGALIYFILSSFINMSIVTAIVLVAIFGGIGFALAEVKIPDTPMMGPFRKAGGENIGAMILRIMFFKRKKKFYLYNYKRQYKKQVTNGGEKDGI